MEASRPRRRAPKRTAPGVTKLICPNAAAPGLLVIEGQLLIGKALCEILSKDAGIVVLGDVAHVPEPADLRFTPDLILIDLDGSPVDAIAKCKVAFPDARICALTSFAQEEILQRSLAAGADGFVIKDATPLELTNAIATIAAGNSYVDPRVAGKLLRRKSATNWRANPDELQHREIEIVCLIAQGHSNKAISEKLKLSEKTVKNYISRIFSKLQVTARTQAAAYAFKSGMV